MEDRKLIVSRIRTPDGTILVSRHVHDYVTHVDANGLEYMLDGGNEYQRYTLHRDAPHTDISMWSDSSFEEIRLVYCRGGRGKNGDKPLKWIPLCEMSDDYLKACIIYNSNKNHELSFASKMYSEELNYRKERNISIKE